MKRILSVLVAAAIAFSANAGTIVKNFNHLNSFSGISISNTFDATLVQGDDYSASVTIDTDLVDWLDVSVVGNVLYVRLKENSDKIKELTRKAMKVTITTPSLVQIHLSGASTLRSDDLWESAMERFTLSLTGASKATKLRIGGSELKADVSGASNCSVIGDFAVLDIDISGASAITVSGQFDEIEAKASGTSKISLFGKADEIDFTCSGSSFLNGEKLNVNEAKLVCNGASKATIDVNNKLDVELTGASTCRYRTRNESLMITPSISRASSFKRIN